MWCLLFKCSHHTWQPDRLGLLNKKRAAQSAAPGQPATKKARGLINCCAALPPSFLLGYSDVFSCAFAILDSAAHVFSLCQLYSEE